jgi:hypothetical protein
MQCASTGIRISVVKGCNGMVNVVFHVFRMSIRKLFKNCARPSVTASEEELRAQGS